LSSGQADARFLGRQRRFSIPNILAFTKTGEGGTQSSWGKLQCGSREK
jgi:hypothetical protein